MKLLRRLFPYALVILAFVLVFPLIYGCSEDSSSSNRFYQLLKLIPSDINMSETPIILIDYASDRFELGKRMSNSFITGYGVNFESGTIRDEYVGYNYTVVDAEIQAGPPPYDLVAAIGRFDPQATCDALSHQGEWPSWAVEAYTVDEYRGVTIHSWGDGLQMRLDSRLCPPHVDRIGRARPLAVTDNNLFYAFSIDAIKLMIDTSQGDMESLADLPEFTAVTSQLAEMGCYSVMIADESLAIDLEELQGKNQDLKLKRFIFFGSGIGKDSSGTYITLVLFHDNSADAELNVSLLEQRISDSRSIKNNKLWNKMLDISYIKAEDNLLIAKLYPTKTAYNGLWLEIFLARDNLLSHESQ